MAAPTKKLAMFVTEVTVIETAASLYVLDILQLNNAKENKINGSHKAHGYIPHNKQYQLRIARF